MRNEMEKQQAEVRVLTPEHFRALKEMGFIPYRDKRGKWAFYERETFTKLVSAGSLTPGSAGQ